MSSVKWQVEAQEGQIPALTGQAANEDSPSGGALYRLIARRPSRVIPAVAGVASLMLLGAAAAYVYGRYGFDALETIPFADMVFIATATLGPLLLVWLSAYAAWRGQEMHIMAEALARTAIRLTDPASSASGEIGNIAQSVQREVENMKRGLNEALEQATNLKTLIVEEMAAIENGSTAAEARAATMQKLMESYRENLLKIGEKLESESASIGEGLDKRTTAIESLIGSAEERLQAATNRVSEQSERLVQVSDSAHNGADRTATMLDRQASRLEVVATHALEKAETIASRYETQRQIIGEAAEKLDTERTRLENIFNAHRDNLAQADKHLHQRTEDILIGAAALSAKLTETFDEAAIRASGLRETISGDIQKALDEVGEASGSISRSAGAATRAIAATVEELQTANNMLTTEVPAAATRVLSDLAEEVRKATEGMSAEITRLTTGLGDDIAERTESLQKLAASATADSDVAAERFNAAMLRLGAVAREAGLALHQATDELEDRIAQLPNEAASSATALTQTLQEQVTALASIAEIVVRHARVLDRSTPSRGNSPASSGNSQAASSTYTQQPSFQPPPLPEISKATAQPESLKRRWGISELLAAAGRSERETIPSFMPENQAPPLDETEFQRSSLQIIETLQSLAIDLDKALEQTPPPELWQRYQAGERNVFTRRLYNLAGRQLYDRVAVKYRTDSEFRENVDRFISLFERLLAAAVARDRSNILVDTYLSSDTGKAYLMLAQATGKLA